MFRVKRHNQQPYSLLNFNGSRSSIFTYLDTSSAKYGDLLNNIRPDKEYYDIIYKENILDLRHTISPDILNTYYLNKGLYSLFTGSLQTKESQTIRRVQFGMAPIDYISNENIILHINFNNTFLPDKSDTEDNGEYFSNESKYKPIYKDSVINTGLYIDGRAEYKYIISNYNVNNGTFDFYIQPYWDGHSSVCQTLFTIYDYNGNAILNCIKQKSELQLNVIYSVNAANYIENKDTIIIDLTEHLIFAKRIYFLRLSWSNDPALNKMFIYLNGNIVGEISYYNISITPAYIIIGNKNDAINNGNLILNNDEDNIIDYNDIIDILNDSPNTNINWLLSNEKEILYNNVAITENNLYIFNNPLLFANERLYRYDQSEEPFNIQNNLYSLSNIIISDINVLDDNGEIIFEGKKDEFNEFIQFDDETLTFLRFIHEINYRNSLIIFSEEEFIEDPFPDLDIDTNIQYGIIRIIINEEIDSDDIKSIIAEEQRRLIKLQEDQYNKEIQLYEQQKQLIKHIKEQRTNNNYGFVIEELTFYNRKYEEIIANTISNSYWPNIPNDFLAKQALILPSFNAIYRSYSDNSFIQNDIVEYITGKYGIFIINAIRDDKFIIKPPKIYNMNGKTDYNGHILAMEGTWKYIQDKYIFTAKDTTLTSAVITYSLDIPNGNGGEDLPIELLAAGLVNGNNIYQDCAFARLGTTDFRPVNFINPNRVSNEIDTAYDHSTIRTRHDCYARILYYHMSGNSTNYYRIPNNLYGNNILNIIRVTNNQIVNIQIVDDHYDIWLQNVVSYGSVVEFVIALDGWIFDYETQTKTLVSNICKTQNITFTTDGINNSYLIPVHLDHGGILKAVCSVININNDGEEIYEFAAYINGEMYPKQINPDTNLYNNQLMKINIDESSWDTPFLSLSLEYIPQANSQITIPVLITYQPKENEILSLWYKIFVLYIILITKNIYYKLVFNINYKLMLIQRLNLVNHKIDIYK